MLAITNSNDEPCILIKKACNEAYTPNKPLSHLYWQVENVVEYQKTAHRKGFFKNTILPYSRSTRKAFMTL